MAGTLLLVRNGETAWNVQGIFLGMADVPLTDRGLEQAWQGGRAAREEGVLPDVVHTSLLVRSIHSAERFLAAAGRAWVPVRRSWALNERHYGVLQGREEQAARKLFGDETVTRWRTSSIAVPDPIPDDDDHSQVNDPRYRDVQDVLPKAESIAAVGQRVSAYFRDAIVPDLRNGTVLVVTHGNPMRTLIATLQGCVYADVRELNLPAGVALRYEIDVETMTSPRPPALLTASGSQTLELP